MLNIFTIIATIYISKEIWKSLNEDEEELKHSKELTKTEVEDKLEIIWTQRVAIITIAVITISMAMFGLIGAIRLNICLLAIYDIFCVLTFALLALGWNNYVNQPLYYSSILSFILVAIIIVSYLLRSIKVEPQWIRNHFNLIDPRDSF